MTNPKRLTSLALLEMGNIKEAEKCHRTALDISRQFGLRKNECIGLLQVGNVLLVQERFAEALEMYESAGKLARELNMPEIATHATHRKRILLARTLDKRGDECDANRQLGVFFLDIGEPSKALECFKDALECAKVGRPHQVPHFEHTIREMEDRK